MAGFVQNLLQDAARIVKTESTNAVKSFFTAEYLRDYTHASKTFVTNSYGYSPKFKFLFHVYFDINKEYIGATANWPKDSNFGLTVKSVQLPKYTMDLTTLNQYNRKRVVQTKIKYDPINIVFHDDNSNLVRKLWYTYYTYYYKDATQLDAFTAGSTGEAAQRYDLNRRNIYDSSITGNDDWGYIGESGKSPATNSAAGLGISKAPFFKAINVYGFNQHNFVMYRLINPVIESFGHDTYNYSEGSGIMENQMSLQYETVRYYEGAIDGRTPSEFVKEFGDVEHYDKTLSPIARPGSNGTIIGQGGLTDAAGGILTDLENGNFAGAIQKAGAAANTFKNPQSIINAARGDILGAANDALSGTPNRNSQFGFPTDGSTVVKSATDKFNNALGKLRKSPAPVNTE
jgi:hypothetical protein